MINKYYPKENDSIIFYFDRNDQKIIKLTKELKYNSKFGLFEYENIIKFPFGTKVFSKSGTGFIYIFPLTKNFWSKNLLHKTQILYPHDISNILFRLNVKKGDIIVETGTGSGSLTFSLSKKVGNKGKIFSFEYNEERVNYSKENFKNFKMDNIEINHRDVYDKGFVLENLKLNQADAIFVDLPSPWLAAKHVSDILKKGGMACTFSPCIEQVIKTKKILSKLGFSNFETVELLERNHDFKPIKTKEFSFEENNIKLEKKENYIFTPTKNDEKTHTGYLTYSLKFN